MRVLLLAFAAVCCAALAVNAQVASIVTGVWPTADCSGTPYGTPTIVTTGVCIPESGFYMASYCDPSGDWFYYVYFDSPDCSTDSAWSIVRMPTACGFFAKGYQQQCVNARNGPAQPLGDFPPAGWAPSVSYTNQTTHRAADTCEPGPDVNELHSAGKMSGCRKRWSNAGITMPSSQAAYCSADGKTVGSFVFSDATCQTVQTAIVFKAGCHNGALTTCLSGGDPMPALPTTGFTEFSNDDCTPSGDDTTYLFANSNCFDSSSFSCAAGNATRTRFSDPTDSGACTTATQTETNPAGKCIAGTIYNCGGAAHTAKKNATEKIALF